MSKIQLVIEIDEEEYNNGTLIKSFNCYSKKLDEVIYSGTLLPKGHGRIGDLDILVKHNVISESYANMFAIIEADGGGKDEANN